MSLKLSHIDTLSTRFSALRHHVYNSLKSATNIASLFSSTGINKNFLQWITNYNYTAQPNVGTGETALAILIKDGNAKCKNGDITIGNKNVEVKGSGGRIKGQHGYSNGVEASKYFSSALKDIVKRLDEKDRPIALSKIPVMGSNSYQLGKASIKKNVFNKLMPELIKLKAVTTKQVIKHYESALTSVFHKMNIK